MISSLDTLGVWVAQGWARSRCPYSHLVEDGS